MNWISVNERKPIGYCWITVAWQHYVGETTSGLAWCDGERFYNVTSVKHIPEPCGQVHIEHNWQAAVTHWIKLPEPPKPPAPYILRDGAMFDHQPTAEEQAAYEEWDL